MGYIDPKALAEAGFTDEITPRAASVIVNVAGLEGSGKTFWALSAPKPLYYQGTDFGTDGVIQKANGQIIRPRDKDGKPREYKLDIPHDLRPFVDREEKTDVRQVREGRLANYVHENFYRPFYADYKAALDLGVKTVVWDTAEEVWEFVRLSVYGRTATSRDDLRTEANSKMKELIRLASLRGVNLIMVNRLKPKWESYYDNTTGAVKWRQTAEMEMTGFDKCPQLVALNLWLKVTPQAPNPPMFEVTVKKCRDNADLVGQTFPAMPWVDMMAVLVPGVESWEQDA